MILSLEPTNACNLKCLHCMRDKLEDRRHVPLDVVRKILREVKDYGLEPYVALTGGEPTLHPQFDELLETIVREGFRFHIISNGFQFKAKVLPILLRPHVRRQLDRVAISLDGATASTHDANRGEGAFNTSMEMAALCKLKDIPVSLITVINNFNKDELMEIALLGSGLETRSHLFGPLHVTPQSVLEGLIPSPEESKHLISFVALSLAKTLKTRIVMGTGAYCTSALLQCGVFRDEHINVDYQGKAIFCCTLSHPTEDGEPNRPGEEVLADLEHESLGTAIVRAKLLAAKLTEERLRAADAGYLTEMDHFPCWWCLKRFGKLGWLQNFPRSPWTPEQEKAGAEPLTSEAGSTT